jgi:hypothetical protein
MKNCIIDCKSIINYKFYKNMKKFKFVLGLLVIALMFPTNVHAVVQTLNSQTGQTQTFADDTNVTISSANNVHSLGWIGVLPISRGGTGTSSLPANKSILFSDNGTINGDSGLTYDKNSLIFSVPNVISTSLANLPDTDLEIHTVQNSDESASTLNIFTASGGSEYNGGALNITSGDGGTASGNGGEFTLQAGLSYAGNGGNLVLSAGDARNGNGNGGDVVIGIGQRNGSGSNGKLSIAVNSQHSGIFNFDYLTTTRNFIIPDKSGTFTILEANQTFTGLNKFEANENSTIYVGSSVKSGCIVLGDSDGSGVTYITADDGVLSATSTKPSNCQ